MTLKHRFWEGLKPQKDLHPGTPGAAPALSRSGAPASKLSGTCPCSHLTCPVPAGPTGISGPLIPAHPPIPCPPGASFGTIAGVSVGREPKRAPSPQAWPGHSLSESSSAPWVREGGGDTGRLAAATGRGGVGSRGLDSLAALLVQPGVPGSLLAARWLAPGASACSVCARARVCASVRAGTPARLFCFRFCFWEGACALPARAPPRLAHWEV